MLLNLMVSLKSQEKKVSTNKPKIQDSLKTLVSNTGLKMQSMVGVVSNYASEFFEIEEKPPEFFCDWLTVSGNKLTEENLTVLLNQVMLGGYWDENFACEQFDSNVTMFRGGHKFTHTYENEIGAKLHVRKIDSFEFPVYQVLLKLSGKVLSQVFKRNDLHSIAHFVNFLVRTGVHITRFDLSCDDYQKKLNIIEVKNWVENGNYQGFQSFSIHQSGGKNNKNKRAKTTGLTIVCGSRESDKVVRIYDTFVKHKKKAIRVEGEFKDKKAKAIQDYFVNYCETSHCMDAIENYKKELLIWCINLLLSSVSFCDVEKGKRVGTVIRFPEFEQWENWKNYLSEKFEKVKLVVSKKVHSVRDSWNFLNKQAKGILSLLYKGLGKKTFIKLITILLKEDENKERPEIINKDRQLAIASMQKNGIYAVINEEEEERYYKEHNISFSSQSGYYEPFIKEDSLTANKKVLRSQLKKREKDLKDLIKHGGCEGVKIVTSDNENFQRLKDELNNPLEKNNYFKTEENNWYNELLENYNVLEFLAKISPSALIQVINKFSGEQKENITEYLEDLGYQIKDCLAT